MTKVCITGIGAISAIGNNVQENHNSLKNSQTGISNSKFFKSNYSKVFPFGEIKLSNQDLLDELSFLNKKSVYTRTDLISFKAFTEAIKSADLSNEELSSKKTAFISSSTIGGMSEIDHFHEDSNLINKEASPFINSYNSTSHLLKIVKHYKIKGHTNCINTACSSSANAIMLGSKMIQSGIADRVIVGGVDSLSKYTVNGFNALQILSKEPCKPFDNNRTGLTLGEAAAYLVLEKDTVNKYKYAEIAGYGNSNDAFHASSISEDAKGIVLSISKALKSANIKSNQIDYINTHGTATNNNDQAELLGVSKLFNSFPPFNSTKSYTGHTLAASGALEAIFSVLSIKNNELYKSLNVDIPIEPFNIMPISNYKKNIEINTILSNSFGFAGNCTSLIIRKCI